MWDLLRELIVRDFKLRYQRSYLGIGWSLLNPLSQLLVFTFLFGRLMPLGIGHYTTYLLSGVLAWAWFSNAVIGGSAAVTSNPELVRRPGFPAMILPVLTVLTEGTHFLLALPILIAVAWVDIGSIDFTLAYLAFVMLVQATFSLSIAYVVAAAHVQYRDTQDAVRLLMMLAFYLTPVFYDLSRIDRYRTALQLNPMVHILKAYRDILIGQHPPDLLSLSCIMAISALTMVLGMRFFDRQSSHFVEEL